MVISAGISGSVSAKILAENGCKVLLVDRATPPRDKACSGVQLRYMEKLIGEKIPGDVLCSNTLDRIRLTTPSGRHVEGRIHLMNFWRRDFDHWLNHLAADAGSDTLWGAEVSDLIVRGDSVSVTINAESIDAKYIVGADGLSPSSFTRRQLMPDTLSDKVTGASINLFYEGSSSVRPDTLYLYYRRSLSDLMYSWLYYKDDMLVIGTSSTERLGHYAEAFLETVETRFDIKGREAGREGYSTHCKGGVFLGRDRVLLAGDAAGLLDLYRGVGMDSAALSGRLTALSIIEALKGKGAALANYTHRSRRLVSMIKDNARKQEARYASDKAIEDAFSLGNIVKGQLAIAWAGIWNRFCEPEDMKLLPP